MEWARPMASPICFGATAIRNDPTPTKPSHWQRPAQAAMVPHNREEGIMRIAAMAAGAVGSYFGGRLAAAGHDVFFIARRAHLEALRKNGLKLESVHGDLHLPKVNATDDPKEVGVVDIVLFAVKLWDTETAAELTRPMVGPD